MDTMLSIIVPAYNAEKYLADCLNSILASTYRNFEILLIDDGSVDGTGEICDRFQRENTQIKVFHTENRGLPSARNLGLENADGQFVAFVDADDLVTDMMYAQMISMADLGADLAMCRFARCTRENAGVFSGETKEVSIISSTDAAARMIGNCGPYVWNRLYRRDILVREGVRFRIDAQGAEDLFFNAEYLSHCKRVALIDNELYVYVYTDGSITSSFRTSHVVSDRYMSLPRASRYASEVLSKISPRASFEYRARAVMYYQTVLRKLKVPSDQYLFETLDYVSKYKSCLLRYSWGWKYYCSALVLSADYKLWARIFRRFQ